MKHRISAGGLLLQDGKILLVRHQITDRYDFWVAPGGGVEETETLEEAAVREVREETGLDVEAGKKVYLEEFYESHTRYMKIWVLCTLKGGTLSIEHNPAAEEYIVEARFFSREDLQRESRDVYPRVLKDRFWTDLDNGFPEFVYIGMHEMKFY